jgi:hypothetical protein
MDPINGIIGLALLVAGWVAHDAWARWQASAPVRTAKAAKRLLVALEGMSAGAQTPDQAAEATRFKALMAEVKAESTKLP